MWNIWNSFSAGKAVSIAQRIPLFHDKERSLGFEASVNSIERAGKLGGPRYCRLSVYVAIEQAEKFLKKLNYKLPEQKMIRHCTVHELNDQCHGNRCPYYPKTK